MLQLLLHSYCHLPFLLDCVLTSSQHLPQILVSVLDFILVQALPHYLHQMPQILGSPWPLSLMVCLSFLHSFILITHHHVDCDLSDLHSHSHQSELSGDLYHLSEEVQGSSHIVISIHSRINHYGHCHICRDSHKHIHFILHESLSIFKFIL